MTPDVIFWLAVMILCVVIEASTVTLVCIWFALGALAALITALPGGPFGLQLTVFAVCAGGTLALTRPICKRYLEQRRVTRTNADRNIGETAICIERIDNSAEQGAVRLLGKIWTARSADGSVIEQGSNVKVESISGVKLIVSPAPEPQSAPV